MQRADPDSPLVSSKLWDATFSVNGVLSMPISSPLASANKVFIRYVYVKQRQPKSPRQCLLAVREAVC